MRCRVQNVTRLPNGTTSTKDREVTTSGNRVRIGRGTDNDIVLKDLSVAFRHADIIVRDFDIVVEAVAGSAVRFDDVPAGRGVLAPETVLGIGPYQIRLLPPERGFDLDLAIESGETAATAPVTASAPLRLRGGLLARRPLSWLLFAAALVGCLVLPVLANLGYQTDRAPVLADGRTGGDAPKTVLAGFDHAWDTGELSNPHKFLEQRCEACHVVPFQPIRNEDCGACHGTVRHHFADKDGVITSALQAGGLEPARCTACHSEHRGPNGAIPTRQALCVGCHQDLTKFATKTELRDVTDFGRNHPQFRPSVVVDAAAGTVQRVELGGPVPPKESSGLRFDHACHLGGGTIRQGKEGEPGWLCAKQDGLLTARSYPPRADAEAPATGELVSMEIDGVMSAAFKRDGNRLLAKLTCTSCHLPDAGGANMRPVSMENHCSYCHSLEFDKDDPRARAAAWQAPRGRRRPHLFLRRRGGAAAAAAHRHQDQVAAAPGSQGRAGGGPGACAGDGSGGCAGTERGIRQTAGARVRGRRRLHLRLLPSHHRRAGRQRASTTASCPCRCSGSGSRWRVSITRRTPTCLVPTATRRPARWRARTFCCRRSPIAARCHQGEVSAAAVPSTCIMCHVYHQEKGTCPMVPGAGAVMATGGIHCPMPVATAETAAGN